MVQVKNLLYSHYEHSCIVEFLDARWVGSLVDMRYITRYCVFIGRNIGSWKSKKKNIVSLSSANFRVLGHDSYGCF